MLLAMGECVGEMQEAYKVGELCVSSRCLMGEEEEGRIQNDDLHTKKLEPQPLRSFARMLENVYASLDMFSSYCIFSQAQSRQSQYQIQS
jgi:hypothetical protein